MQIGVLHCARGFHLVTRLHSAAGDNASSPPAGVDCGDPPAHQCSLTSALWLFDSVAYLARPADASALRTLQTRSACEDDPIRSTAVAGCIKLQDRA